ncbi:amidohydrolase family protein [candidate division KSB1 bacterium]
MIRINCKIIPAFLIFILMIFSCSLSDKYDIIIINGTILDGTGAEAYTADIGIRWNKIAAIGDLKNERAWKVVDAQGLYVSPGFIDVNGGSGIGLLGDGTVKSKISQGITSVIFAGDDIPAPIKNKSRAYYTRVLRTEGIDNIPWRTVGDFLDFIADRGTAVNVGTYSGMAQIKRSVLGLEDNTPNNFDQNGEVFTLVEQAFRDGAFGMSADFTSTKSAYFQTPEIAIMYGRRTLQYGQKLAIRLRFENEAIYNSLGEIGYIIAEENVDLEILGMKLINTEKVELLNPVIERIESFNEEGYNISANIISSPYFYGSLLDIFPRDIKYKGWYGLQQDLENPNRYRIIDEEFKKSYSNWENILQDWKNIRVIGADNNSNQSIIGKTLFEILGNTRNPYAALSRLILSEEREIPVQIESVNTDAVRKLLLLPWTTIGSGTDSYNGNIVSEDGNISYLYSSYYPGTIGVFGRDEKVIPLEDMIHKITGLSAANAGILDRGTIQKGALADITIFDLESLPGSFIPMVSNGADTGIRYTIVNGTVVYDRGNFSGKKPGRIIFGQSRNRSEQEIGKIKNTRVQESRVFADKTIEMREARRKRLRK